MCRLRCGGGGTLVDYLTANKLLFAMSGDWAALLSSIAVVSTESDRAAQDDGPLQQAVKCLTAFVQVNFTG